MYPYRDDIVLSLESRLLCPKTVSGCNFDATISGCIQNKNCNCSHNTRQTRKIGPGLARLRVHWHNIVPYMGIHWANFSGLSGTKLLFSPDLA